MLLPLIADGDGDEITFSIIVDEHRPSSLSIPFVYGLSLEPPHSRRTVNFFFFWNPFEGLGLGRQNLLFFLDVEIYEDLVVGRDSGICWRG